MSGVKLTAGLPEPAVVPGRVQLFGSDYNPFCQRVHMVLIARDVPHDFYEVGYKDSPSWLGDMQPDKKHPVLRGDGQVFNADQDILKYLHDKYPGGTGQDSANKDSNIELLKKFRVVTENFMTALKDKDFKPSEEGREFFRAFEEELTKRGTTFLGGDSPGTPDYMIWPWFERFRVPFVLHGLDHKPPVDRAPGKMSAWREAMQKTKAVNQTKHTVEEHVEACKLWMQK